MRNTFDKKAFAKKSFGQNFLTDPTYISKIVDALHLSGKDTVIEIGAGRGALTEQLVAQAGKVFAIEFDRDLVPVLREQFAQAENFTLVDADALNLDFSAITGSTEKVKLVANLPYNISTAILQRLIEYRSSFSSLVLMFQREVVDRIVAETNHKERGFLSVLVQAAFTVERLFDVPGSAFKPIPKVWSSVVRLEPTERKIEDPELFRRIVSSGFMQKRKTILNNFKAEFPNANDLLQASGIDPRRRAETLTIDEWTELVKMIAGSR